MMQINFSTVARQEQVLPYLNTFVSDGEGHFLPCVGVAEAVEVKYYTVLCQYFLLLFGAVYPSRLFWYGQPTFVVFSELCVSEK